MSSALAEPVAACEGLDPAALAFVGSLTGASSAPAAGPGSTASTRVPPALIRGLVAVMAATTAACEGPNAASTSFAVDPPPLGTDFTSEPSVTSTTTGTTEPVPEDSSTSSTSEASTSGPPLDIGMPDLGDLQPKGCKGKIDFLFVISRFGLMEGMQARLIEAFPYFIETIESKFADFDYHIMVVDGDETWGSQACEADCSPSGCPYPGYPCDVVATPCDETMGAGTVFPAGNSASNEECGIVGGHRYLTREQPQLAETFACLAQVGLSGYDKLGEAATAAMSAEINGPGGCNEGFLRDDALLMVTFIANTPDTDSEGKPKLWAEAIAGAKHGDPSSVVMFSIQKPDCNPWDMVCDLVKYYFPYWYIADNEELDYRPAFDIATNMVGEACSAFIPQ